MSVILMLGIYKLAIGMGLDVMMYEYMPSFIKIGSVIQKLLGGYRNVKSIKENREVKGRENIRWSECGESGTWS
jgi:hypothetical protein